MDVVMPTSSCRLVSRAEQSSVTAHVHPSSCGDNVDQHRRREDEGYDAPGDDVERLRHGVVLYEVPPVGMDDCYDLDHVQDTLR